MTRERRREGQDASSLQTSSTKAPGKQTRAEQAAPSSQRSTSPQANNAGETQRAGDWNMDEGLSNAMGLSSEDSLAVCEPDQLGEPVSRGTQGSLLVGGAHDIAKPVPGINLPGFIDHGEGSNLRTGPAESGAPLAMRQPLPPATRLFVSGVHPDSDQWWYVTAFLPSEIVRGYVQDFRVTTDLPEPTAKLHQIESGDTVEALAVREFSSAVRDGHDLRFYENVLLKVNRDRGRSGIRGSYQDPGALGGGANNIQLVAGHRIWLVSPAYARSLEGVVPDGSLTNGAYAKAKRFAGHIEDILDSVTRSPDHLGEVAGTYAQVLRDHLPEIIGVTAAFIMAESLSALLAVSPTGVGQLAAAMIQLALAAFGAHGLVAAGVEALDHGSRWLNLAWRAGGKEEVIAQASREFLRMLVAIAMAALAYVGTKGNISKAAQYMPTATPLPAFAAVGGRASGGAGALAAVGDPQVVSALGAGGAMMVKHEGKEVYGPDHAGPGAASGAAATESIDAWVARLKAQGVKGDLDKIAVRAKGTGSDAIAARGELRAAERAHGRGYDVEMLTPPEGPGAVQGQKTPEGKLTAANGSERGLEVKTATSPPDRATWNAHADKANKQIKSLGKPGEISFDWSDVNVRAGGDFRSAADIEAFLNGKMTNERLREVKYFEIIWKDEQGVVRTTSRTRNADGTVGAVETK